MGGEGSGSQVRKSNQVATVGTWAPKAYTAAKEVALLAAPFG